MNTRILGSIPIIDLSSLLIGPTYQNRSFNVNNQVTQNFYVQVNNTGERLSLNPFPGLKAFSTAGVGANRGMGVLNNTLYTISGNELYSVSSTGTATLIGSISGNSQCFLESDGTNLVIATTTTKPYTYDGSTLTLGTDADLPNASSVAYINNRVVYDGNNADVAFADLGSPLVVDSSNITANDVSPDDTLAVVSKNQRIYVFGEDSIVPYFNSGTGNPPFSLIQNATVTDLGLGAIHSIATNKNHIYFLGSDLQVYRLRDLFPEPIGNPAMGQAIAGYSDASNARGCCFTLDNQEFYLINFPGGQSWLFSESAGWTTLTYGLQGYPSLINDYQYVYGKHIVSDRRNGNLYELDFATYQDNSNDIQHQRDTLVLNSGTFGTPGKRLFMNRLELKVEMGTSLSALPARVGMQYSDDFGNTWSTVRVAEIGATGEYKNKVEWYGLGSFYDRIFRFRMTDPVKWVLTGLNADIEIGV